ncbi:PhoD-like phosphatase-domain-containing protein, partial [Paraphysoderma sedebokerense]
FKHGIASGDPLQDKVILWTKVTPSNQDIPILVKYQVFSMDGDVVKNGEVTTTREVDYIVKVDVDGLRPNTQYQYQFSSFNDVRSAKGRTKTLPEAQANVDEVRLAFVSCSNFQAGWFNAYRDLANENFDIVVHLGDYIYEHGPREVTAGDGSRRPRPEKELVTLEEYRLRHAQYKTDVDLQNLHVGHPFITIWDDHEFANNAFKDNASAHDPATEGNWEDRKRAAMRAYFEYLPIRPVTPDDTTRIYRSFSYGNLVDLHMLDTRIIGRDDPDADINSPNKTILGAEQEKWLFDSLQASQNRNVAWKVVGNQVVFSKLFEALGFQAFSSDTWDKYPANRAKVQNFIKSNNISDVQFLVGDAHVSYGKHFHFPPPSDYNPETGQGAIATEFVIPSVTS